MTIEPIHQTLRLRKPDKSEWEIALPWYQNPTVLALSEGVTNRVYTQHNIYVMYEYLSTIGDLYFIEVKEGDQWRPIGDVTLWEDDLPIAIGEEAYWRKGIGKLVIKKMLELAKMKGYREVNVPSVFHYNAGSKALFESLGFKKVAQTETDVSYRKIIK